MPTVVSELTTKYVATEPFETVIDTLGSEYKAQGDSNGLPRSSLIKRSFIMVDDEKIQVSGINVSLPKGKQLNDPGQALQVLKLAAEKIVVRDRVKIDKGQILPPGLGSALAESKRYPVREAAPEVSSQEPEKQEPLDDKKAAAALKSESAAESKAAQADAKAKDAKEKAAK